MHKKTVGKIRVSRYDSGDTRDYKWIGLDNFVLTHISKASWQDCYCHQGIVSQTLKYDYKKHVNNASYCLFT